MRKVTTWLSKLDFAVKIVVAGNHDISLDPKYALKYETGWNVTPTDVEAEACRNLMASIPDLVYLQHSNAVISIPEKNVTLRVFGSPYSPDRGKQNWAFQYSQDEAAAVWEAIPKDTQVLITHTPPFGICDTSAHWQEGGCDVLKEKLRQIRPALHVCGHCHEGRGAVIANWAEGSTTTWTDPSGGSKKMSLLDLTGKVSSSSPLEIGAETAVVNASIMAKSYGRGSKSFNKAVVVDLLVPNQHQDKPLPET